MIFQINTLRIGIAITFLLLLISSCSKQEESAPRVRQGSFIQTVTETGELEAVNMRSFVMPRYGRYWYEKKIIGLLDHGSVVNAGDSLIQFDPAEVMRFILDRETRLEVEKANLEKTIVEIENRKSDLNSTLRSEQAAFNLKKLEVDQFNFESERARQIKQLEFDQAKIRLEKVKRSIEHYKIISNNQLRIQEINLNRIQQEIKNAYEVIPELTIRTPIPGIFQVATKRRSRDRIQIGDEVSMGNRLGNVPDLTWMKASTVINEADFMKVYIGQKVNVRLDALPNVVFEGEVTNMSKLCRPIDNNSRRKVFDVEVKLVVSDERLKPGMTVSCEYICAELENVYYVPLQCLYRNEDRHYIFTKKSGNIEKIEVKPGPSNNTHVVVTGNIEQGLKLIPVDEAVLTDKN
jgi:hypothetical protein